MKYTSEIDINLSRDKVIELFDSTDNLFKWQKGLQSFDHLSGEAGQEGAKSKLVFQSGKRKMEMVETILHRNLPEEFHGSYEMDGVLNIQKNFFMQIDENTTRWISESEFQFKGLKKYFFALMKGAFKKQTKSFLIAFKEFAEEGKTV